MKQYRAIYLVATDASKLGRRRVISGHDVIVQSGTFPADLPDFIKVLSMSDDTLKISTGFRQS